MTALAERSGALLATSICGHGLFAGNPWSVGISGGFASPAADELICESDLIIGFGASLTHWTTKRGKLIAPWRRRLRRSISRRRRLGYQMPVQHAIQADARVTAQAMLAELEKRGAGPRPGRRHEATRKRIETATTTTRPIRTRRRPRSSIRARSARRSTPSCQSSAPSPPNSGHFCGWVPRFLRVPNARASCLSHSFQSVGLGLASAIGLAIANPGPLAVLGAGDGGFLMSIADLETAVRLKLQNVHPGIQRQLLCRGGASLPASRLLRSISCSFPTRISPPSRGAMAPGGNGQDARRPRAVRSWVREGAPGVFVIDAKIDPDLEADWHAEHFP